MMKVVELSDEEISVALALIELGGKTAGLAQFGNAAFIANKLQNAPVKAEPGLTAQVPTVATEDVSAMEQAPTPRRNRRSNGSDVVAAN